MTFRDLFCDRTFNREFLKLSLPLALQSLMLALVAAADAAMLGASDQNSMAAVSLATQVQFIQNMVLFAIAGGVGVLGAQYWGKGDRAVLERIFGISVRLSAIVSVAFFAGCLLAPEALMRLFAHDPTLVSLGVEYLKMVSCSYLLTGISQSYLSVMRVTGHASRSAWISSAAVVVNIALNAVFIFGLLGAPAMGVRGAALATVCARVLELAWCVLGSRGPDFIPLTARAVLRLDRALSRDFWHYTLPILGASLLWGGGFTSYTAVMGHLGPDAAAGNSIAAVVRDLLCCLCNGFCGASAILIGNELGAGRLETGRRYGDRVFVLAFVVGFACTLLTLACIPILSRTMKLTPQAHEYMVGMFVILSVYMIGRSFCTMVINGIFTAGGDTRFDVYSLLVAMYGIALPCAFLGAFHLGWPVLACYACTCLDEVGKIPWVCLHYRRYQWVRNITRDL